jgi:hypothetical protein
MKFIKSFLLVVAYIATDLFFMSNFQNILKTAKKNILKKESTYKRKLIYKRN